MDDDTQYMLTYMLNSQAWLSPSFTQFFNLRWKRSYTCSWKAWMRTMGVANGLPIRTVYIRMYTHDYYVHVPKSSTPHPCANAPPPLYRSHPNILGILHVYRNINFRYLLSGVWWGGLTVLYGIYVQSNQYYYCNVPSKRPWVLGMYGPKIGGGCLHEQALYVQQTYSTREPWDHQKWVVGTYTKMGTYSGYYGTHTCLQFMCFDVCIHITAPYI